MAGGELHRIGILKAGLTGRWDCQIWQSVFSHGLCGEDQGKVMNSAVFLWAPKTTRIAGVLLYLDDGFVTLQGLCLELFI